jgi:hypothetical protein
MISSYRVPGGSDVKVMATVVKGTLDEMTAQKGTLIWKFGGPKPVAQATTAAPRAAAMASDARAGASQSNVYDTTNYTGRKVDFNVKDIDIKNLLGAIAEISKKNIIVADDVKGSVTIKLRNVPWDRRSTSCSKRGLGRETSATSSGSPHRDLAGGAKAPPRLQEPPATEPLNRRSRELRQGGRPDHAAEGLADRARDGVGGLAHQHADRQDVQEAHCGRKGSSQPRHERRRC